MAITFISSNPGKAGQLSAWLGQTVDLAAIDLPEIQSFDLREITHEKAKQGYSRLKKPVLVEDVSLIFVAMGQLPGPYIKWFEIELGYEGICKLMYGYNDKTAIAKTCYCYYDGDTASYFEGEMRGRIANKPIGEGGFGFDKFFISAGYDITRAQMTAEDYAMTSYRLKAIADLRIFFDSLAG